MPDWTYHPLRHPAAALLGERRAYRTALHALAMLAGAPGGHRVILAFVGRRAPAPTVTSAGLAVNPPVGAIVGPALAADAVRCLPPLGAGVIEVAPVGLGDVDQVRRAARGRRCVVVVRVDGPDAADVAKCPLGGPGRRVALARRRWRPAPQCRKAP